jgi:hypothetical protein
MKKHTRKLRIDRETVRQLTSVEIKPARGGVGPSIAPENTCSQCFVGCQTGDACA